MARRRTNGEGSIYRRKDGRWEASFYSVAASGIRKRVRIYGKSRSDVHEKLTDLKAKQQQGIPVADKSWRTGEYLDYWLEQAVRTKRKPLTYQRSESIVRLHLKPGLGRYTLSRLSVRIVQAFLDQLHGTGTTEASLFQIRKVLSAALAWAVRKELLFRNVARLVELPRYKPAEAAYWSADELRIFLEVAKSDPLYSLFLIVALYGLRSGEVRGIRWCDVDFARNELHIRKQVQRIDRALQVVPLKTESSRRDEPLLLAAKEALLEQRAKQAAAQAAAGDTWQGSGDVEELVFTTKTGRPIEARNVFRSFQRICTQHNLKRITLHGLRHSNATAQKNLDVQDRDTQAILGHSDLRTTGIYTHVSMENKRAALEKVEQQLFTMGGDSSARSRQLSRQSHDLAAKILQSIRPKENTHLCWVGTFFGGSSQTRTGDTRLFRTFEHTAFIRITEVQESVKNRTRQWILGAVAVNLAVRTPVDAGI
ncbi:Site-specific recombinase XerD [Amycolatopsis lurida]|uniref:tyrosine-type recombinase/integrase n=1 Tax=Amycolatopsis lurida TaxID=31959 RepID=UPI0008979374|nr:site-specific integrase [Amycolatopsis lurida]SED86088.1 Site-specific recombinase XerD [Amycolatopsis lurida]